MKGMETAVAVDGGLSKGTAFALAAVAEVLLVAIFGLFIQKNYFVLLYLNITITLCVALPRLLCTICYDETCSYSACALRTCACPCYQ